MYTPFISIRYCTSAICQAMVAGIGTVSTISIFSHKTWVFHIHYMYIGFRLDCCSITSFHFFYLKEMKTTQKKIKQNKHQDHVAIIHIFAVNLIFYSFLCYHSNVFPIFQKRKKENTVKNGWRVEVLEKKFLHSLCFISVVCVCVFLLFDFSNRFITIVWLWMLLES